MTRWRRSSGAACLLLLAASSPGAAEQPFITVASTTSTEESGLFGHLLPAFTRHTGIQVHVIAVGTGQALKELRDLARGIHPPVLADRGLEAAVTALADASPLRVLVHADIPERPAAPVESAAYFVVAEALANEPDGLVGVGANLGVLADLALCGVALVVRCVEREGELCGFAHRRSR